MSERARQRRSRRSPRSQGATVLCATVLCALGALGPTSSADASEEIFTEELLSKPLGDGKVFSYFEFNVRRPNAASRNETHSGHYDLFPRLIGQVIESSRLQELHLSFTQGRWWYEDWGYPIAAGAGTGVELWAWLEGGDDVNERWTKLTNTLAGLFCVSLNFIGETITVEPRLSFAPEGIYNVLSANATSFNAQLRRGYLPHENVCTENLTPWIKLLPCQAKAGIARLLNPYDLYNSNFHSMAVNVRTTCEDAACTQTSLELMQTVSLVRDVGRKTGLRDWSLRSLFDRKVNRDCPVAAQSRVSVVVSEEGDRVFEGAMVSPTPSYVTEEEAKEGVKRKLAVYDLKKADMKDLNVEMTWSANKYQKDVKAIKPRFYAHQYFTGYGQERGGIRLELHNAGNVSLPAEVFQSVPWFLKVHLHTLHAVVSGVPQPDVVERVYFQPALDRGRPAVLEMEVEVPPQSVAALEFDFEKVFLKYTEHPPDANRGFDIGPAVVTVSLPKDRDIIGPGGLEYLRGRQDRDVSLLGLTGYQQRVYTGNILVSLPTPDFSMPYNVITLTCTLVALFLGSVFNLTTRKFEPAVVKGSREEKERAGETVVKNEIGAQAREGADVN